MEDFSPQRVDRSDVRLSNSPANSPTVIEASESPARSVHLEAMGHSAQHQQNHETPAANFFDDISSIDDGEVYGQNRTFENPKSDVNPPERSHVTSQSNGPTYDNAAAIQPREGSQSSAPPRPPRPDEYMPSHRLQDATQSLVGQFPADSATSAPPFTNPVLGAHGHFNINDFTDQMHGGQQNVGFDAGSHVGKHQGQFEDVPHKLERTSSEIETNESAITAPNLSRGDQILSVHAMTLQALESNDEEPSRTSTRTPRDVFATGLPRPNLSKASSAPLTKRVSIIPPPLEIRKHHGDWKEGIVRTPYPIHIKKAYPRSPRVSIVSNINEGESILVLSLRCHPNKSPSRVVQLTIPASLDIASAKLASPSAKEKNAEQHFKTLDYDDSRFFQELRSAYGRLTGRCRFFSARKLVRIEITYSQDCESQTPNKLNSANSCGTYFRLTPTTLLPTAPHHDVFGNDTPRHKRCSHFHPRPPKQVLSHGLVDSFSEDNVLAHFRRPSLGKARYMWVHWAHRVSTTPPSLEPSAPSARHVAGLENARQSGTRGGRGGSGGGRECMAGLDFVQGWALARIVLVGLLVKLFAVAVALVWIFWGTGVKARPGPEWSKGGGYKGAGDRVMSGVLVGLFVLILGSMGMGVWVWGSWLME